MQRFASFGFSFLHFEHILLSLFKCLITASYVAFHESVTNIKKKGLPLFQFLFLQLIHP